LKAELLEDFLRGIHTSQMMGEEAKEGARILDQDSGNV
jgi:hypothetical protein